MSMMKFTRTVFKNLFSKPATRLYPTVRREATPATRGRVEVRIEECIFCGICAKKCPTGAIAVDRTQKSWAIERFGCIACGLCVISCPKKCIDMKQQYTSPTVQKYIDTFVKAPEANEQGE